LTGRFQIKIKIKIKSADQKTADFVIERDVRARATATATATAEPYSVKGGSSSVYANPPKLHAVNCGSGLARECGGPVTDE
jgi:hypothetical protein